MVMQYISDIDSYEWCDIDFIMISYRYWKSIPHEWLNAICWSSRLFGIFIINSA